MTAKRQPRQSREDLRTLLLREAQALLREEGLGVGTETLTFKRVFDRVERETGIRLTNASVIRRIWENQTDYQTDVLLDIAADEGHLEMEQTFGALGPVLEALDLSTPEKRHSAIREICRVGGAANIAAISASDNWSLWFGVWSLATAGDVTEQKRRLQAALLDGYESVNSMYENIYLGLIAFLGFRLRPGLTIRQFTVATGALAEGCALRSRVESDMDEIFLPTGPDDDVQDWTLFSVGLDALCQRFFELDPDWSPGPGPDTPPV